MLGLATLDGMSFLDIGSGSGLSSLAARRLGARVHSFDYDPSSVQCTRELRYRYFNDQEDWVVEEASVLDKQYLRSLGCFDIVYSWGVLHHTGAMWEALENIIPLVSRNGGRLFLAIYNDQGRASSHWLRIKRLYNKLPPPFRWAVLWPAFARLWGPSVIRDTMTGQPLRTWTKYSEADPRGMSPWRDVVDWVGGLPFEVAKPERVFHFYRQRGFVLERLTTCAGGHGCNEYVFRLAG